MQGGYIWDGPWQCLGVPYTNLVQSVQFKSVETSLGLELEQYYKQPVAHQDLSCPFDA